MENKSDLLQIMTPMMISMMHIPRHVELQLFESQKTHQQGVGGGEVEVGVVIVGVNVVVAEMHSQVNYFSMAYKDVVRQQGRNVNAFKAIQWTKLTMTTKNVILLLLLRSLLC